MSAADCPICEASGYRTCDDCGGVVFGPHRHALGSAPDLCAYCIPAGSAR